MLNRHSRSVFNVVAVDVCGIVCNAGHQLRTDVPRRHQRHRHRPIGRSVAGSDRRSHGYGHRAFRTRRSPPAPGNTAFRTCRWEPTQSRSRPQGFKQSIISRVPVTAGVIYTLPVKLSVAAAGETVEVNASGLALDTTSTTQTTDIPEDDGAGHSAEWARLHPDDRHWRLDLRDTRWADSVQ